MSTYVAHGDSVTLGVRSGVVWTDTYAYKVGTARGFTNIIDSGIAGNTSSDGLARFASDVLSHNPTSISIMFGVNDNSGVNLVPVATYQENIDSMVVQGLGAGAKVTLLTPNLVRSSPYITRMGAYIDALKTIAYNRSVPCVDCYSPFEDAYLVDDQTTFNALWVDSQHPSPTGHSLIASAILKPYNANAI